MEVTILFFKLESWYIDLRWNKNFHNCPKRFSLLIWAVFNFSNLFLIFKKLWVISPCNKFISSQDCPNEPNTNSNFKISSWRPSWPLKTSLSWYLSACNPFSDSKLLRSIFWLKNYPITSHWSLSPSERLADRVIFLI